MDTKELILILEKYQKVKSTKAIKNLILAWARVINDNIYNTFWKSRNDNFIIWEKNNYITITEKRNKKGGNRKLNCKNRLIRITGKKLKNYGHEVNDNIYNKMKEKIFGKDFHKGLDKRVGFLVVMKRNYYYFVRTFLVFLNAS